MKKSAGYLLVILISAGCGSDRSPVRPDVAAGAASGGDVALGAGQVSRQVADDFPFKKILCFGDSITLGVTLSSPSILDGVRTELALVEGYVPKLWRLLEAKYGTGIELVNAGIGGENTREALERIDTEIRLHRPNLVLVMHGIVDINSEFPRYPIVRSNLAEMIRIVKLRGAVAIAGTYPLINPEGFRSSGAANIPRLNDVIRQEAKGKNAPIADHEATASGQYAGQGPDGLHPNNIGYETMAQTWFDTIELVLEEMTSS